MFYSLYQTIAMPQTFETFTLGHSPDPDDAFMFYALAENKIDTHGYKFEHILQDIETLNQRATQGELHISAISIHAYSYVLDKYALLPCGASMGDGYGPIIVAKNREGLGENPRLGEVRDWLRGKKIAIPGQMTSAYLALRLALGECDTVTVPFDEIFAAVKAGSADAGLIIHEGQLTYQNHGLVCSLDLGKWWMERTGLPLPLGGNVIRRDLGEEHVRGVTRLLKKSIQFSLDHREEAVKHALKYARDMDVPLADKFVGMYVNHWTLDYGPKGREAVNRLLDEGTAVGMIPRCTPVEFIE